MVKFEKDLCNGCSQVGIMAKKEYVDYIPASRLAEWRESNKPGSCDILGHEEYIPVVDHDHSSGRIRGVISSQGNALLGKVENFFHSRCIVSSNDLPSVLRAMANYLEKEQGKIHPTGARQLCKRFGRMSKDTQISILLSLNVLQSDIDACVNSKQRTALYRNAIVI